MKVLFTKPASRAYSRATQAVQKGIAVLALCIGVAACTQTNDGFNGFTAQNIERLLSTDSSKTWMLTTRQENGQEVTLPACLQDDELHFYFASSNEADTVWFLTGATLCLTDATDSTAYQWQVPEPPQPEIYTDTLNLFGTDTLQYIISFITPSQVDFSYQTTVGTETVNRTDSYTAN